MQLFSADPTIILKFFKIFVLTSKKWKKHPRKLLRIPPIHFFSLTALTAKQNNSFSKIWPIDQLWTVYKTLAHPLMLTQTLKNVLCIVPYEIQMYESKNFDVFKFVYFM